MLKGSLMGSVGQVRPFSRDSTSGFEEESLNPFTSGWVQTVGEKAPAPRDKSGKRRGVTSLGAFHASQEDLLKYEQRISEGDKQRGSQRLSDKREAVSGKIDLGGWTPE